MKSKFLRAVLVIVIMLAGTVGALWWAYNHRPIPPPIRETLFEGIKYIRDVRTIPRRLVIHIVWIDLSTPGLTFFVTPGVATKSRPFRARTTSQFLSEFHTQLAINGDFCYPWHSVALWDYYPHVGDPVSANGVSASRGNVCSTGRRIRESHTLYISEENRIRFRHPPEPIYNAVSGGLIFLNQGVVDVPRSTAPSSDDELHPRTAVGVDRMQTRMLIAIVDGRQPNYSEGVTLRELGNILLDYGGYTVLELDGGGSTTLVKEGRSGEPVVLNSPIDNRIPGRERAIANHLGVFVKSANYRVSLRF